MLMVVQILLLDQQHYMILHQEAEILLWDDMQVIKLSQVRKTLISDKKLATVIQPEKIMSF